MDFFPIINVCDVKKVEISFVSLGEFSASPYV